MLGSSYVLASWRILRFYTYHIFQFGKIHDDLPSGRLLHNIDSRCLSESSSTFRIRSGFAKEFNRAYEDLQAELRKLIGSDKRSFEMILFFSFAVRAVWAWSVWKFGPQAIFVGFGQFIVAPMSFVMCMLRFGTNAPDCVLHYAINALVAFLAYSMGSYWPSIGVLRFDATFAIIFVVADFVLNLVVYLQVSEAFGMKRLLVHMAYGTFNTKTYFAVVIGTLCGFEIDLLLIIVVGMLTVAAVRSGMRTALLSRSRLPCFSILFYCEHRINHCPIVYQHAHKMHHYLHDTTSFDAHIYGSGMNEEFFWILAEILPCLACPGVFFPYFLNLDTLQSSWSNKGGHTRTSKSGKDCFGDYDYENFHADHHTLHRANFGS